MKFWERDSGQHGRGVVVIVPHNQDENDISKGSNETIINTVRAALTTAKMDWSYWSRELADENEKYNQLLHAGTERTPH